MSVKAIDGQTIKYGKQVSELQENIVINDNSISGTLKNVASYPQFGDEEAYSSSHYLALSFESKNANVVKTRITNGTSGWVDITEDMFCVYRIKDNAIQKIEIVATRDGEVVTKTFSLTELILEDPSPSGTNNYNDLDNKPMINGVELVGDVAFEDIAKGESLKAFNPSTFVSYSDVQEFTKDYNDFENKPRINGVELINDVALEYIIEDGNEIAY